MYVRGLCGGSTKSQNSDTSYHRIFRSDASPPAGLLCARQDVMRVGD
ncbi:unnamed protein product [Rhodiola kirilowii]